MATKKKKVIKKAVKKTVKKEKAVKIPFPKALKKAPKSVPGKFYTFRQNNSFGRFDYDAGRGISVNVIVEADNTADANSRAERIGLYFDGAGDCPCCGTRWSEQYSYTDQKGVFNDNSSQVPEIYGEEVGPGTIFPKKKDVWSTTKWMKKSQPEGYIHYKDGRVEGFWK